ncbi:MAG: metallophosphoesterase family protein [Methyloligellaceae bacterium]
MKIYATSDLHNKKKYCEQLVLKSREADVITVAGDFGKFRREKDLVEAAEILKAIDKPMVIVHGNHESLEELQEVFKSNSGIHILQGNSVTIEDTTFFGIGGGIPETPFGKWSCDYSEEEALELLRDMPENSVLVSHSPPKGTLDRNLLGFSLGSTVIRDAIIEKRPLMCICGHIHESSGRKKMLDGIPVINAGPKGMMLSLSGDGTL